MVNALHSAGTEDVMNEKAELLSNECKKLERAIKDIVDPLEATRSFDGPSARRPARRAAEARAAFLQPREFLCGARYLDSFGKLAEKLCKECDQARDERRTKGVAAEPRPLQMHGVNLRDNATRAAGRVIPRAQTRARRSKSACKRGRAWRAPEHKAFSIEAPWQSLRTSRPK